MIIMRIRIESHRLRSLENLKVAGHWSQLTFTCPFSSYSLQNIDDCLLCKNTASGGDNDDEYLNDNEDDFYNGCVLINQSLAHLSMRCHMLVQLLSILQQKMWSLTNLKLV